MMMQPECIWAIEDDPGCRFVYDEILSLRYRLRQFQCLEEFKTTCETTAPPEQPDLIIADVRLPDDTFLNILTSGRWKLLTQSPFLVVSSIDDLDALRLCFKHGAADYLTKPFARTELIVKVENILAHRKPPPEDRYKDLIVDPTSLTVTCGEKRSEVLTPREFQIIALLKKASGNSMSREEIVAHVWETVQVSSKTLDVHLSNLRKKLAPLGLQILHQPPSAYKLFGSCPQRS